jgi:hypothetical protein
MGEIPPEALYRKIPSIDGLDMRVLVPAILAVVLVLGMSPAVFAVSPVPFEGSGSGTFSDTSSNTVALTGSGHYTHLGLTTITATSTITGTSACGGFTATEQDTYAGANGDAVYLTVHEVFCSTSASNVFLLSGTFTVTGGTGRFEGASGSGTIQATATFLAATSGSFSGTTAGTIAY